MGLTKEGNIDETITEKVRIRSGEKDEKGKDLKE